MVEGKRSILAQHHPKRLEQDKIQIDSAYSTVVSQVEMGVVA